MPSSMRTEGDEMKEIYEAPQLTILLFKTGDVIVTSGFGGDPEPGNPEDRNGFDVWE